MNKTLKVTSQFDHSLSAVGSLTKETSELKMYILYFLLGCNFLCLECFMPRFRLGRLVNFVYCAFKIFARERLYIEFLYWYLKADRARPENSNIICPRFSLLGNLEQKWNKASYRLTCKLELGFYEFVGHPLFTTFKYQIIYNAKIFFFWKKDFLCDSRDIWQLWNISWKIKGVFVT